MASSRHVLGCTCSACRRYSPYARRPSSGDYEDAIGRPQAFIGAARGITVGPTVTPSGELVTRTRRPSVASRAGNLGGQPSSGRVSNQVLRAQLERNAFALQVPPVPVVSAEPGARRRLFGEESGVGRTPLSIPNFHGGSPATVPVVDLSSSDVSLDGFPPLDIADYGFQVRLVSFLFPELPFRKSLSGSCSAQILSMSIFDVPGICPSRLLSSVGVGDQEFESRLSTCSCEVML